MTWKRLVSREGVDIATIGVLDHFCYTHIQAQMQEQGETFFTLLKDRHFTHLTNVDNVELGRRLYKKEFNTPEQIKTYFEEGKILLKEIESEAKKAQETDDLLSTLRILKKQFLKVNDVYCMGSWLAIESWQTDFEKILSNLIKKNNLGNKQEQILDTVYTPWKKTAIYEIQDKIEQGIPAEQLVKEHQFLRSWALVWYRPIEQSWIENLGKAQTQKVTILTKEEIKELLKPNEEEQHFLNMAPYILFFKDWRDDLRRKLCYLWTPFVDKVAQQLKITHDELGYLLIDEMEEALKTKNIPNIKKRRENPCVVTIDETKKELTMKVVESPLPEQYKKIIKNIEQQEQTLEIKGLVAQPGKAKGRVIIVRSYHDLKKVEEGDILVANTTHPTYLPAMHRAAAFITNEGGIASHAAIVAREMKKPCIVGTKVATKVLHEGDIVEVNADNGKVKKLT